MESIFQTIELLSAWFSLPDWTTPDWLSLDNAVASIWWVLVILLIAVGLIGSFLPILPGTLMIWAGALIHYFGLGREASGLAWQVLLLITIFFIAALILDWLAGALGARFFGSSKFGIIGVIVGGIVGLFFGLPGLILGPIVGVFVAEMIFGKKKVKEASNSTLGTVLGGLGGMVARGLLAIAMVIAYTVDVFVVN